jgi:hypothetical protein
MKRYEELTVKMYQEGVINTLEAATIAAAFEFTVLMFNQVGKEAEEKFKEQYGDACYSMLLVMARGRRAG